METFLIETAEMLSHHCKKHPANRWFPVHPDYKSAGPYTITIISGLS
jgi:hypothetical protein